MGVWGLNEWVAWLGSYVWYGWLRAGMRQVGGRRFLCVCTPVHMKHVGFSGTVGVWAAFPKLKQCWMEMVTKISNK